MKNHTTIKCGSHRHKVTLTSDGAISTGCEIDKANLEQAAILVSLGAPFPNPDSCQGLAALLLFGLDDTVGRGAVSVTEMGGWRDTYVRWQTNVLVEQRVRKIVKHSPAHQARIEATKILRRMPFFKPMLECDFNSSIEFRLELEILPDEIECHGDSFIRIPLQKSWMENVHADPSCQGLHRANWLVLGKTEVGKVCMCVGKDGTPDMRVVR